MSRQVSVLTAEKQKAVQQANTSGKELTATKQTLATTQEELTKVKVSRWWLSKVGRKPFKLVPGKNKTIHIGPILFQGCRAGSYFDRLGHIAPALAD